MFHVGRGDGFASAKNNQRQHTYLGKQKKKYAKGLKIQKQEKKIKDDK